MRWKKKKEKFKRTKLNKRMRILRRKNKHRRRNARRTQNSEYSIATSQVLREKKFYTKSVSDYIIIKTDGKVSITIPKDFSMVRNPDEVIDILKKIFYCGMKPEIKEIIFDHSRCNNLGIAASTVMDAVVLAAKSYHKSIGSELTISGNYPNDEYTKDIFIASGLVKHLKINKPVNNDKMIRFKLVSGNVGTQNSGQVATKLTNYFNECLKTQQYVLTDAGENNLASMFGEILDNCEKHGGDKSIWYALGHYQIRNEYECGEIQLTIFNFGDSIYEQLCNSKTTNETQEKLRKMTEIHSKEFSDTWTQDMMYTVFSLQEGISRLRDKNRSGYRNRGRGTITLMDTFYRLGQTKYGIRPELIIVSGHTWIKFDDKYSLEKKVFNDTIFGNKERKVIAFNKENDIYKKADSNVALLKNNFPGTIISMKFYLDQKYLDSYVKEVN